MDGALNWRGRAWKPSRQWHIKDTHSIWASLVSRPAQEKYTAFLWPEQNTQSCVTVVRYVSRKYTTMQGYGVHVSSIVQYVPSNPCGNGDVQHTGLDAASMWLTDHFQSFESSGHACLLSVHSNCVGRNEQLVCQLGTFTAGLVRLPAYICTFLLR